MKTLLLAAVTVALLSTGAYAGSCPALMGKIDEALATAELSDADKAKVAELREQGAEQHEAGEHAESVNTLNEALQILGM